MQPRIAYILPSYQNFEYARACLVSLHTHSPFVLAIVVDDASPDWKANSTWWRDTGGPVYPHRYSRSGGLTRSWNAGMIIAQRFRPDYIVFGNNDVLFSSGWWKGLCWALESGYALAGPVSNAPGVTAPKGLQHVRTYLPDYQLDDNPVSIDKTARLLRLCYTGTLVRSSVNGFFMMAKARTWREHGYRAEVVFPPLIKRLPTGSSNRTPAMTGQEDWLQSKWQKQGLKSCIVPSSFIFHYRSVSRGRKYVKGDFMRMVNTNTARMA